MKKIFPSFATLSILFCATLSFSPLAMSDSLESAIAYDGLGSAANGFALSPEGRVFLTLVRFKDDDGPRLVEVKNGKTLPYPDASWNQWSKGKDTSGKFVEANALRFGPDGDLWVIDAGSLGAGQSRIKWGPKIVRISTKNNTVRKIYDLNSVTDRKSYVDDIRFNGNHAYLTDAGSPGLIVLDIPTGHLRRILNHEKVTKGFAPIRVKGQEMVGPNGKPVIMHADQLEVSPDGQWFYFQSATGPLYRIPTKWMDDESAKDSELKKHVEQFAKTETTGGTAIDANGTIYSTDPDHQRILKIAPDGTISTLVSAESLIWPGSRRTGFISIRPTGGRTSRWPTSCLTGRGRSAWAR